MVPVLLQKRKVEETNIPLTPGITFFFFLYANKQSKLKKKSTAEGKK